MKALLIFAHYAEVILHRHNDAEKLPHSDCWAAELYQEKLFRSKVRQTNKEMLLVVYNQFDD